MNVFNEIRELEEISIRSKSMFSDDFSEEMEVLIEKIEDAIDKEIIPRYKVEYANFGTSNVKIKINDDDKSIYKLINCKLAYNKTDLKFGYVHPEFISSEKSQKTTTCGIGKFSISEQDKIVKELIKRLIIVIEEY